MKNFIKVALLILSMGIILSSCEKEEDDIMEAAPYEKSDLDQMLISFDQDLVQENIGLVGTLMSTRIDTLWVYASDGVTHIIDSSTMEPMYNGTENILVTFEILTEEAANKALQLNHFIKSDFIAWMEENDEYSIRIDSMDYSEDDASIINLMVDATTYQMKLVPLNQLGSLIIANPTKPPRQIVEEYFDATEVILVKSMIQDLTMRVEDINSSKSALMAPSEEEIKTWIDDFHSSHDGKK